MSKILFVKAFLLVMASAGFLVAEDKPATCGDLLAELHKKPKNLDFMSCNRRMDLQGKPWRATYRVAGAHAAEVEKFFVGELDMRKLEHACCGWASNQNSFSEKDGRVFDISMSSEETTVYKKDQWRKIPYFYVDVDLETEAP